MIVIIAVAAYFVLTAIIILSVCVLSARMRSNENWEETPIVDAQSERGIAPDYQTDVAAS